MSFSHSIEIFFFLLLTLFLVSNFPFETLIVFSLGSNLFVFRFLFLFFERTTRDALQRNLSRRPEETGPQPVD